MSEMQSVEELKDLSLTTLECACLEIALAVLRSDTDYGDFLNYWLHEYGKRVVSPTPPPPLLPEISVEEELSLAISGVPAYIH